MEGIERKDIDLLKEMCNERYSRLSDATRDSNHTRRMREIAKEEADETMAVWRKLEDLYPEG